MALGLSFQRRKTIKLRNLNSTVQIALKDIQLSITRFIIPCFLDGITFFVFSCIEKNKY